jgi:hypothetical protein
MTRSTIVRAGGLLALAFALLTASGSAQSLRTQPQPQQKNEKQQPFTPKFEALAETRLLMEGMAHPNYRSLQKLLKDRPADNETWTFVRGQALLLAESGNLLLLRPPRNNGRDTWMKLSMAMRDEAGELARKAAARNHVGSKAALVNVTNACNKCHQTFRVNVRIGPDKDKDESDAEE